ncbi:MAG: ComEC/Rec2 family competence protein, partial [Clostridia bacterium]|nr:ComEC/Rec2 family competence protein [Clostridia bacterium]
GWSAQVGTLPVQITKFGYVSAAGLFLNIVFVPVISAVYVLLFFGTVICAVLPFAAQFILPVAVLPLQLIINLITECGFENALIYGTATNWLFVPFLLAVLGLSDKFNFKLFPRGVLVSISVLAVLFGCVGKSGTAGAYVTFCAGYNGGAALVGTPSGNVLIVTQDYSPRDYFDSGGIDALVVLGDEDNLSVMFRLGGNFSQVCMRGGALQIPEIGTVSLIYADEFEVCGVQFEYAEKGTALSVTAEGVTFTVTQDGQVPTGQFGMYCKDGYTLLYTGQTDYNLKICGSVRFGLAGGQIAPPCAVPKE